MGWIEDNKGAGPWEFNKSQVEGKYNEGNKISILGDPVWSLEDDGSKGIPITPTHNPNCGMWNGLDNPGYPPPPPFVPTVSRSITNVFLQFIAWTPNVGGIYGRFVGLHGPPYSGSIRVWYSDDGGYNWIDAGSTALSGSGKSVWKFKHIKEKDLFVASGGDWPYNTWTATSQNGINWTMGTPFMFSDGMLSFEWCSWANRWIGITVEGGGTSRVFSSPDALVWTYQTSAGLYNAFNGSAVLNSMAYFLNGVYSSYLKTNASLPVIVTNLVGTEIPPYSGYEAINNDDVIVYGRSYYNGSVWADNGVVSSYIDYNPLSHRPSNSGLFASFISGNPTGISVSRDGISWTYISILLPNQIGFDIAAGYERVITLSGTNYCTVTIVS